MTKEHYLLHPPCAKGETSTWGHHEATNLTGQTQGPADRFCHCLWTPEEKFTNLREQTNPRTNTTVLRPYSLTFQLCPPPQETGERSWDRARVKNQRDERDCIPPALQKCPTSSSSMDEVQAQDTVSVAGITLQLLPSRGMLWLLTT